MNREDFLMLKKGIIYFDNGATTLKPTILAKTMSDYYNYYSANAHRGDYDISLKVDNEYEGARQAIANFLNCQNKEVIFTSNATDALNKVIFGFFKNYLKKGDEVLITKSEHASLVLPWLELADDIGLKIKYIELDKNHKVTIENIKKTITSKTKVISIAHISNVIGDVRPIKEITNLAHNEGILVLVDGAQSVPHLKIDVTDLDVDFLTFSAHKMCGPTGVGVLYGKEELLNNTKPIIFGGGMNATFSEDGIRVYDEIPQLFEAGTQNIAGVIGFGKIISHLDKIGMNNIHQHEIDLKKYALEKLKTIKNIIIYNESSETGIITFNIDGIFAQDLAIYLNKHSICVRAGNHCAKILKEELKIKNTCRLSFYFYNTKKEIDKLIEVLNNPNIKDEII